MKVKLKIGNWYLQWTHKIPRGKTFSIPVVGDREILSLSFSLVSKTHNLMVFECRDEVKPTEWFHVLHF